MEPIELLFSNIQEIKNSVTELTRTNTTLASSIAELIKQHALMLKECEHRQKKMHDIEQKVDKMRRDITPVLELLVTKRIIGALAVFIVSLAAGISASQVIFTFLKNYLLSGGGLP